MQTRGQLFIFEGPDGVGKSSLAPVLTEQIKSHGRACEYLAFPGRKEGTLGHHVYQLHHRQNDFGITSITPTALQILHIAAHIDAIEGYILPTLKNGISIVLDRFWWSTLVYGKVTKANFRAIEAALKAEIECWQDVLPTAVFLIDRTVPILSESTDPQWPKLRAAYYELAEDEKEKYPVRTVKNEGTLAEALEQVIGQIQGLPTVSLNGLDVPATAKKKRSATTEQHSQLTLGLVANPVPKPPPSRTMPMTFTRFSPAVPSEVFDTYWRFAAERQRIFFRKFEGCPPPFTEDPILVRHKFTNAYRASDRVSQYLIRHVLYEGEQAPEELFFRAMLFKIFNHIGTWQLLEKELGEICYSTYRFERYDAILTNAMREGITIFSAAYIMPSGGQSFGFSRKHRNYLKLLEKMISDNVPNRLSDIRLMRQAFELLRSYPLIGDFLAYQYVTDLNYSQLTNFSEMEFVIPGPGARDGIRKCFRSLGGLNESEIIHFMADRQEEEFTRLGIQFRSLWGRPLQLIDCQNLFCEVDKYARIAHPEIRGVSGRTRIKQTYHTNAQPIDYWYPPTWGINHLIELERVKHDPSV